MKTDRSFDVTAHLDAMTRYARSLARGDLVQADDLVNEALVRALEAERSFRTGGNLRGWLLSILHNTFVSLRRRAATQRRTAEEAAPEADAATPASQDAAVRLAQIRAAFDRLPEDQRVVLHLVAVEGLSYQETADVLGIPMGTVMSRLGRGREALRRWEAGDADALAARQPNLKIVGGSDAT